MIRFDFLFSGCVIVTQILSFISHSVIFVLVFQLEVQIAAVIYCMDCKAENG